MRISAVLAMAILTMVINSSKLPAAEIKVAVASNFINTIKAISKEFEILSGHKILLVFGSTGRHYAQIRHGAPFDAYFAADTRRPQLLDRQGLIIKGSRFTYAIGKVVLWSPQQGLVDKTAKVLANGNFKYLSIANPKLAPYGLAARQILQKKKLWQGLKGRMVRGENVGQAYQFVKSGNAELGFVSSSQITRPGHKFSGSKWVPDQSLYDPINQQAVLLSDNAAAHQFMDFVKSQQARAIITAFGYGVEDAR